MSVDNKTAEPTAPGSASHNSPTVSVVIPAYGHRNFIGRTLDSVFAQTWTDYEIIVVNDGSPDDTEAVLQPCIDAGKIRYVRQQNAGVAAARNRGIEMARGEFIALLDDDDLWPPNKLASQVALLRANPSAVMVYGNLSPIDADDAPHVLLDTKGNPRHLKCDGPDNPGPSGQVFEAFTIDNWIISPGQTLIRRSTLIEMGEPPLDTTIWGNDDWDLWLRLADRGEVLYSPEVTLHYRFHANNASRNVIRLNENILKVLRKHRNRQRGCRQRFQLLTQRVSEKRYWIYIYVFPVARLAHQQGEIRDAMRILLFLARINPRACINRQYIRLFRDIGKAMLRVSRGKLIP